MLRTAAALFVMTALFTVSCGKDLAIPQFDQVKGVYLLESGAVSMEGIDMTLTLNEDLTAEMVYDYYSQQPSTVETGSWVIDENGTVLVQLNETGGVPMYPEIEFRFALSGDTLKSVSWDRSIYGAEELVFRKS